MRLRSLALAALVLAATAPPPTAQAAQVRADPRPSSIVVPQCAFTPSPSAENRCLERVRDSLDVRLAQLEARFQEARRDSARIPGGWRLAAPPAPRARPVAAAPHGALTASKYAVLAGAVLAYNAACPFGRDWCERDPGGYHDAWKAPDKYGHALGAAAVTSIAMQAGVSPWRAFAVTNLAGAGLELTQAIGGGRVSGPDMAWNALGALSPVVLHFGLRRWR